MIHNPIVPSLSAVPASGRSSVPTCTLFLGNLSFAATVSELCHIFRPFSPIDVRIIEKDGKSRGFGYVDFVSEWYASQARAAAQGFLLHGRCMRIDFSAPTRRLNHAYGQVCQPFVPVQGRPMGSDCGIPLMPLQPQAQPQHQAQAQPLPATPPADGVGLLPPPPPPGKSPTASFGAQVTSYPLSSASPPGPSPVHSSASFSLLPQLQPEALPPAPLPFNAGPSMHAQMPPTTYGAPPFAAAFGGRPMFMQQPAFTPAAHLQATSNYEASGAALAPAPFRGPYL